MRRNSSEDTLLGKSRLNSTSDKSAQFAAIICNTFWGMSFLASRVTLNYAPVIVILSHRFLLAFLLMSLLLPTRYGHLRFRGRAIWPLLLLGLLEPVLYYIGELYGILHSTTIFSGVMVSIIPIVSIIAAVPILKERITSRQVFFSILSVSGVVGIGMLSNSEGALDWIGVLGLLVAVFAASAFTLLNKRISGIYSSFERTYIMMADAALVFTVMAAVTVKGNMAEYVKPLSSMNYVLALVYLSVFCSVICFFLSCFCISRLSVAKTTIFVNLTTVVSVLAGALILHEPLSLVGVLCCGVILIGIYGVQHVTTCHEPKNPE